LLKGDVELARESKDATDNKVNLRRDVKLFKYLLCRRNLDYLQANAG